MKLVCHVMVTALLLAGTPAFGQSPGTPPSGPGALPSGLDTPPAPPLTKADVEKLVAVIPEMAKTAGELSASAAPGPEGPTQPSPEDTRKIEALLNKYGFTFSDYLVKMTVLTSTYMTLRPDEFDRQVPSEQSPEVQKILSDPRVPDADKAALKKQVADMQANKEPLRAQLTKLATEENKTVVRPMLAKVQKALEVADAESKKARAKMLEKMLEKSDKPKPGPRRTSSPTNP